MECWSGGVMGWEKTQRSTHGAAARKVPCQPRPLSERDDEGPRNDQDSNLKWHTSVGFWAWRSLFPDFHLFPHISTWFRTFNYKNIFLSPGDPFRLCGGFGRVPWTVSPCNA
jgi:hypothetical protein